MGDKRMNQEELEEEDLQEEDLLPKVDIKVSLAGFPLRQKEYEQLALSLHSSLDSAIMDAMNNELGSRLAKEIEYFNSRIDISFPKNDSVYLH